MDQPKRNETINSHNCDNESVPITSTSMAFTVDFDDMNNNLTNSAKKKLGIHDSIRKFAPPKPETIEKRRPKNVKDGDFVTQNQNMSKDLYLKSNNCSPKRFESSRNINRSMNESGNLSDGATFLIQRMLYSEPNSLQNNENEERTAQSTFSYPNNSKISPKSSPLKKCTSKSSSFKSPSAGEMDSGVCDDDKSDDRDYDDNDKVKNKEDDELSEAGTYTVGAEKADPIVEEARKRINEIFGVKENNDSSNSSSSSSKANYTYNMTSIDAIQKIITKKNIEDSYKKKGNCDISSGVIKQKSIKTTNSSLPSNSPILSRKGSFMSEKFRRNNTSYCSTEKLNDFSNRLHILNQNLHFNNSAQNYLESETSDNKNKIKPTNSFKHTKQQTSQNSNLYNGSQKNTFSYNTNNLSSNSLLRKARVNVVRSNRNGLNLDSNNTYEDNISLKSDEASLAGSTDLSSIGSEKCKSDSCSTSTMRFNRAFALRRARLNTDSSSTVTAHSKTTKDTGKPPIGKQTKVSQNKQHSKPATKNNLSFDRVEGGRFSLRGSRTSTFGTKKSIDVSSTYSNPNIISSSTMQGKRISKDRDNSIHRPSSVTHLKGLGSNTCHSRAYSYDGGDLNSFKYKSNINTTPNSSASISAASTSEDLTSLNETINVKSIQHLSPFQLGRRIFSTKPHYMAQTNTLRTRLEDSSYTNDSIHNSTTLSSCNNEIKDDQHILAVTNKANKSLSALDYLVLSAVHQLSFKLRCKLRTILDTEKSKYPENNENRILIEELLPQVSVLDYRSSETSEKTISRDLSNILKNLKRIEQSLEGKIYLNQ